MREREGEERERVRRESGERESGGVIESWERKWGERVGRERQWGEGERDRARGIEWGE